VSEILACIFDFDGILADTERLHWQAFQDVLTPLGAAFSWEVYEQDYIGFDDRDVFRTALADQMPLEDAQLQAWVTAKGHAFVARVQQADVPPFPGAVEAVKAAAGRGPIALCTGALPDDVEPLLRKFGIRDLFQTIVTAADVPASKPDPACYALSVSRLGIPAANCLAIEDTPHGLQAARGAGCQTLGVAQTHSPDALRPYADRVVQRMTDFA